MNASTYIVPEQIYYTYFNHFGELEMPGQAVLDCSHSGACDEDVAYWAPRIKRPGDATKEKIREDLKETGGWDAEELDDDNKNWERIVWIAAGNIRENEYEMTRGDSRD